MIVIISILVLAFALLLGYVAYETRKIRRDASVKLMKKTDTIEFALAGTDEGNIDLVEKTVRSLDIDIFKDKSGNILNPSEFLHFIVHGESMQFCGIHNDDIIFVDPSISVNDDNVSFPTVLVLRRLKIRTGRPQYKIRRAWKTCRYSDDAEILATLDGILSSRNFQVIKDLQVYDGDSALVDDFKRIRLPHYLDNYVNCSNPNDEDRNVIISTTFHPSDNTIRFSIHPSSAVVGRVVASFNI